MVTTVPRSLVFWSRLEHNVCFCCLFFLLFFFLFSPHFYSRSTGQGSAGKTTASFTAPTSQLNFQYRFISMVLAAFSIVLLHVITTEGT